MGYGLDGRDSIPGQRKDCLNSTVSILALRPNQPPIRLVPGAPSLGLSSRSAKLITHLHIVSSSRLLELYPHPPIRLYGVVLN
jgi:hypothetical protein